LVHPVDPSAQVVRSDAEVELSLHPARVGAAGNLAGVVAMEGLDRLLAELQLVIGLAEARAAPGGGEQGHQPLEAAGLSTGLLRGLLAVEALQDLMDDDPEALVDRGLLRDPEDARELVLERAGPVQGD